MRNREIITILLFILCTSSCTYTEDELYFNNVNPGEPPGISIFTNLDSIEVPSVYDSLLVLYEINVDSGDFIWTRFLLSDSLIFDSDTSSSGFWLKSDMANYFGKHTLTMEAYYSTNSGSLADIVGIEAFLETTIYDIWFYENN
jgi:hypothetical protein